MRCPLGASMLTIIVLPFPLFPYLPSLSQILQSTDLSNVFQLKSHKSTTLFTTLFPFFLYYFLFFFFSFPVVIVVGRNESNTCQRSIVQSVVFLFLLTFFLFTRDTRLLVKRNTLPFLTFLVTLKKLATNHTSRYSLVFM